MRGSNCISYNCKRTHINLLNKLKETDETHSSLNKVWIYEIKMDLMS